MDRIEYVLYWVGCLETSFLYNNVIIYFCMEGKSDSLEIAGAIGKWHLATYIPECFPKYSPNFIDGASGRTCPGNVHCPSSRDY